MLILKPPLPNNSIKTENGENGIKTEIMDSFSLFEPSCSSQTNSTNSNLIEKNENEFFAKYLTNQKVAVNLKKFINFFLAI